jgi:hypothetical protein
MEINVNGQRLVTTPVESIEVSRSFERQPAWAV